MSPSGKLVVLSAVLAIARAQQYCTDAVKKSCNENPGASACITDQCSTQTSAGDANFRNTMLDRHNKIRAESCFEKYGANMLEMQWNEELEDTALRWLQYLCTTDGSDHDAYDCRLTPSFNAVGQNLWQSSKNYVDASEGGTGAIDSWYAEKELVGSLDELNPYAYQDATTHFTQMIWADSFALGCAYLLKVGSSSGNMSWVMCNYAKGGNIVGYDTFQGSDTLGSNCTVGSHKASSGLCQVCKVDELSAAIDLEPTQ